MVCVYCGGDLAVSNSRSQKRSNQVWRRRYCKACKAVFTSHEALDLSSALSVASNGSVVPFSEDIIYSELLLALKHRPDRYMAAREATYTVIKALLKLPDKPEYAPKQISQSIAQVLRRLDRPAYLRYLADHPSLQD